VSPSDSEHLVKGNVFVTVRDWLTDAHGEASYQRLLDAMPPEHAREVADPLPSIWHPETIHQSMLHALHETVCSGDLRRYQGVIADITVLGVHKFARLILQMSSNAFVLRRLPTLWKIIRRGPATTEVDQTRERTQIAYGRFPFYGDALYRHYILGVLTGIVRTSARMDPTVEVVRYETDRLLVDLRLPVGAG